MTTPVSSLGHTADSCRIEYEIESFLSLTLRFRQPQILLLSANCPMNNCSIASIGRNRLSLIAQTIEYGAIDIAGNASTALK